MNIGSGVLLAGVILSTVAQASPKAIYAKYAGTQLHIVSASLDGKNKKALASITRDLSGERPAQAVKALVLADQKKILFKFAVDNVHTVGAAGPLFIMNADGTQKRILVNNAIDFIAMPNSKEVVYLKKMDFPSLEGKAHATFEVRALNLKTNADRLLAELNASHVSFLTLKGGKQVLLHEESLQGAALVLVDVTKGSTERLALDNVYDASANAVGTRTAVLTASMEAVTGHCVLGEIDYHSGSVKKHVETINYVCETLAWNNNSQVYYNKSTGPNGKIDERDTSPSGYYALLSVYKYDFEAKKETAVLLSPGSEVYRLQGVIPEKALVVSSESQLLQFPYALQARALDGKSISTIDESTDEMLYFGWVQ